MSQQMYTYFEIQDGEKGKLTQFTVLSLVLHLIVFVVIPIILTLLHKPQKFERPATMQLVTLENVQNSLPVPSAPVEEENPVTEEVPPVEPEPVIKDPELPKEVKPETKQEPKEDPKKEPQKEPVEQKPQQKAAQKKSDLSDLEALFNAQPAQTSSVSSNQTIPNRYLIAVKNKVEPYWNPSLRDSSLAVVLNFSISLNGSLDGPVTVTKSSGKPILDRQAVQAVELAAPFPTLPPNFKGSSLELSYTLIPYEG